VKIRGEPAEKSSWRRTKLWACVGFLVVSVSESVRWRASISVSGRCSGGRLSAVRSDSARARGWNEKAQRRWAFESQRLRWLWPSTGPFGRKTERKNETSFYFCQANAAAALYYLMLFFCPATLQWSDSLSQKKERCDGLLAHNACDDWFAAPRVCSVATAVCDWRTRLSITRSSQIERSAAVTNGYFIGSHQSSSFNQPTKWRENK
jgi:hypothetical protein